MVEGGIETGDLRHAGGQRCTGANGRHIVGLVQRREWLQLPKLVHDRVVGHDRLDERGTAVHHAMADGNDVAAVPGPRAEQVLQQRLVRQPGTSAAEGLVEQRIAAGPPRDKARRDADPLDLPA